MFPFPLPHGNVLSPCERLENADDRALRRTLSRELTPGWCDNSVLVLFLQRKKKKSNSSVPGFITTLQRSDNWSTLDRRMLGDTVRRRISSSCEYSKTRVAGGAAEEMSSASKITTRSTTSTVPAVRMSSSACILRSSDASSVPLGVNSTLDSSAGAALTNYEE